MRDWVSHAPSPACSSQKLYTLYWKWTISTTDNAADMYNLLLLATCEKGQKSDNAGQCRDPNLPKLTKVQV